MNKTILAVLLLLSLSTMLAAQAPASAKTKVLLLGTFHFDNPGLDVAQFENANVLTPKRQAEIQEVINKLKRLNPDKIFLEQVPERQGRIDSLLQQYKEGKWQAKANEIYQVGFKLAKEVPAATLHAVDYTDASFPFDSLMKVAQAEKQYVLLTYIKKAIDSIQTAFNKQLKTLTLRQLLIQQNTAASNHISVGFYFNFLVAGDKQNHIGSYVVSEWWRRNMVIYENILKRLDGKEKTIIVLFGSSHTALLREFMKYNPAIELLDVAKVLK